METRRPMSSRPITQGPDSLISSIHDARRQGNGKAVGTRPQPDGATTG